MDARTGFVVFISKKPMLVVSMPATFKVGTLLVDFFATRIESRVPIRAPVVKSVYLEKYLA